MNFGIVYGIGAFSLAKDIGVSNKEAKEYIDSYMHTYQGVAAYMQRMIDAAKDTGYATTLFGRRRYLPELAASNHMLRAFGELGGAGIADPGHQRRILLRLPWCGWIGGCMPREWRAA